MAVPDFQSMMLPALKLAGDGQEHTLPLGWESMDYEEFLRERRRRMADIIRVAFRQLGGEPDAPPLTPPWFLPGAEDLSLVDYLYLGQLLPILFRQDVWEEVRSRIGGKSDLKQRLQYCVDQIAPSRTQQESPRTCSNAC